MARKATNSAGVEQEEQSVETLIENIDDVNVGVLLKKARTKKKKEIQKIADTLRIRVCYLQALEDSDYEAFPGRAYAIGFLRNYGDFLGLDVDALVAQYQQEIAHVKVKEIDMPIIERPNLFPSFKYLFWAVLVIALMWSFWYFLSYSEVPESSLPSPSQDMAEELPSEQPVVLVGTVEEVVVQDKIVPEKTEKKPEVKKNVPAGKVQILANQEVWVEIEQDDMLILSRTMKKGEVFDVPESKTEMFLRTGNAGGMDILVDGQKVKSLGPVGAVRSGISLSADKLKKR